jgi:hypothetical protein
MRNLSLLVVFAVSGCAPGYIKASDLDSREQGPQHCETRCHELGMKMGALVLVGDSMPGCVCQPRAAAEPVAGEGASGATVGHVVLLAAAAEAQRQQEEQRRRQQEQYNQSTGTKH